MELTLAPAESLVMQCLWESGADLTVYEITERLQKSTERITRIMR